MTILVGNSASNQLNGSTGSDLIDGGAGNDTIVGGGGNDIVDGGAGNDTITTGSGNDLIDGGAGNDTINAGGGTNVVDGGAGNDTIVTGNGDDLIDGGAGNDVINAGNGTNIIGGGAGDDVITGGSGIDVIDGGAGDDQINAGGGTNVIAGGAGNDTIVSGAGLDIIDAGAGNDVIDSGGGDDLVLAGSGDDSVAYARLPGSTGYALFLGEAGRDTLRLTVTRAEYDANATLRAEITAFQAFLASSGAQHGSYTFTFGDGTARLTVAQFERFELTLTGATNSAPVANSDAGWAGENQARSFDVLANDTDLDPGDGKSLQSIGTVTVTSANGSIHGSNASSAFAIGGNQLQFAPGTLFDALAVGQTATVVVAYTMLDAQGATSSSTLTLTVTGANDAPVVTGAVLGAMNEADGAPTVVALMANASDIDSGTNLDVAGVSYSVTQGSWSETVAYAVDAGSGALTIDPAQFDGLGDGDTIELTFSYSVIDGSGGSTPATAVITVTGTGDDPVIAAGGDAGTVAEDTLLVASGNLDISDADTGDTDDWTAGMAAYGTVAIDADTGEWTYTLDNANAAVQGLGQDDPLADSFEVTVTDSDGLTDTRLVTVNIGGTGDDPVIADGNDTGSVVEDGASVATGNLDVGDTDTGDTADWAAGAAAYGSVAIDTDTGEWTYTLDNANAAVQGLGQDDPLADSFEVTVTDSDGLADTRLVTVNIAGTGDDPVIADGNDTGSVVEDGVSIATGNLDVGDADMGDTADWTAGTAAFGTVSIDANTGQWAYSLNNTHPDVQALDEGETLADSFEVTVTDSDGLTDTRLVTITISGTADGHPTAIADRLFTNGAAGTTLSLQNAWLVGNDTDPTNDPLNVGAASNGTNVDQVTVNASTTSIRVNVAAGDVGDFTYTATDGLLSSGPATVTVTRGTADATIVGGTGGDILIDGRTDQALTTLDGGAGRDILVGGSTGNVLVADQADELIDGGAGSDVLQVTGTFDDASDDQLARVESATLAAAAILNLAQQTEGFTVTGAAGNETITTGSGNDTIRGGAGADTTNGGTGADSFVFNSVTGTSTESATVSVSGNGNDRGQDTIVGFDMSSDVILVVATGVDHFQHGNQTAVGTGGGGGSVGSDGTANSFQTLTGLISINSDLLFSGPADIVITFTAPIGSFSQTTFESRIRYKLTGDNEAAGDFLAGGSLGDVLNGMGGFDQIWGGGGDDILIGGDGEDTIRGDAGADQFRFQLVAGTVDRVQDWEDNIDKIGLSGGAAFTTVATAAGTALNAADFVVRSSVGAMTDADDNRVVLVTTTGLTTGTIPLLDAGDDALNTYVILFNDDINRAEIWFDTNWNGTGGRTLIGILENVDTIAQLTQITSTDIVVYSGSVDPIVLDLDGNGFAFAGLDDSRVFDINADGVADDVAWNTSGDGMLAIDHNGNGVIDDGSELFTPNFGGGGYATASEALASLDGNGDGLIDASDEAFDDLFVWRDLDADGATEAGELASLDDWGIASIDVRATPGDGMIDGQEVVGSGSFAWADGSHGDYLEVALETSLGAAPDSLL